MTDMYRYVLTMARPAWGGPSAFSWAHVDPLVVDRAIAGLVQVLPLTRVQRVSAGRGVFRVNILVNIEPSEHSTLGQSEMILCNTCYQRRRRAGGSRGGDSRSAAGAQWAALARLGPSDGSLGGASSV